MNLYRLKTIIYLLLLFSSNVVYCGDTDDDSSSNKQTLIASNNHTLHNNVTQDVYDNIDLYQSPSDLTKFNCKYIAIDRSQPITREYTYEIYQWQQDLLSYPNTIDKIKFNDYIMEFDPNVKLPKFSIQYIFIYTCEHLTPILVCLFFNGRNYFYAPHIKTNKWNNYELKYDTRFIEYIEDDGINYYERPIHVDSYRDLYQRGFVGYKCEHIELLKETAHNLHCKPPNTTIINNLEVYLNKPKIFTSSCIFIHSFEDMPLTLIYGYKIYGSQKSKLSHPNKIDRIEFRRSIIEFDDNAIFPNRPVLHISIYTCEHYKPLLIGFNATSRYYFYSLDSNTNKWTNHKIKYDTRFIEYIDENDIYYYERFDPKKSSSIDKYEAVELNKMLCKDVECEINHFFNNGNTIKIYTTERN